MSTQPDPNEHIPDETYADVYQFPLRGLSSNASVAWGAVVTWPTNKKWPETNDKAAGHPDSICPVQIGNENLLIEGPTINNFIEEASYREDLSPNYPRSIVYHYNPPDAVAVPVSSSNDSEPYIILGKQAKLIPVVGQPSEDSVILSYISTTPFGLNLGASGVWNGSVVLGATDASTDAHTGAHYDANRVATGKWARLSAVDQNNTILDAGVQVLGSFRVQKFKTASHQTQVNATNPFLRSVVDGPLSTFPTVFNHSSEAIIFPSGSDLCGSNVTLTLQTDHGQSNDTAPLSVPLFGNLTSSTDRCHTNPDASVNNLILGKPFLQAAYLLVTYNASEVWLTNAHQLDLPPCAAVFNSSANLIAASKERSLCGPNPLIAEPAYQGLSGAVIAGVVFGGLYILACLAILVVCVRRRYRVQRSAKLAACQQSDIELRRSRVADDSASEISSADADVDDISLRNKK